MLTRCPTDTTCCESLMSLTGYGCCMFPQAVRCPDNWHCCPLGQTCSPDCNFKSCRCIRLVTGQNQRIKTGEAFIVKGRKYHKTLHKGNGKNGNMQRKFKSQKNQLRLEKENHKGGKLNNLRHRNKFNGKKWRKTAAKNVGHRDSTKREREKHRNNNYDKKKIQKARTGKIGKSKFAMKATHRKHHSTAATKPHLNIVTKTAESHNEKAKVNYHPKATFRHFSNFTTVGKSRKESKKKHAKLVPSMIKSKTSMSMTDELEHLIKRHRNRTVPHIRRPNIAKRPSGVIQKHTGETRDLDRKQPTLATIFNPGRKEEVGEDSKTVLHSKKRFPNNARQILSEPSAQTLLTTTAHGQNNSLSKTGGISHRKGRKTWIKQRFTKESRTNGKLTLKPKDVSQIVRKRPYKKSGRMFAKGIFKTESNSVSYEVKMHTSGRIPIGNLHTGQKIPMRNAGSYAGEANIYEESKERTRLSQPDRHLETSYSEASGVYSEESGSSHQMSGTYSSGYNQGKDETFGGESGDDLRYKHPKKERNNPISQNVGSGSEFGSDLWKPSETLRSGKGRTVGRPNKDVILDLSLAYEQPRKAFERGSHKAGWSGMGSYPAHGQGSGEGSGDMPAHTPKIAIMFNGASSHEDMSNSGSSSTDFQETNGSYHKSSQVKNSHVIGEESDGHIDYERQPGQKDFMSHVGEEDISTKETTLESGNVLHEQDQESMESRAGTSSISGEASDGSIFLFPLLSHKSKMSTLGQGSGLFSGEDVQSNAREVAVSGAEYGMSFRTPTTVKRTKTNKLSVKLRNLHKKPKSGFSISTNQQTMVKKSDGQNLNAVDVALWHLEKDHWIKNLHDERSLSVELKSVKGSINNPHHLKRKDEHLAYANSGLFAKAAQSQPIPPDVNREEYVDQSDNQKNSRYGISDSSGLSTNDHIYTKHAGKASRIHTQYTKLNFRKDAKEPKLNASGIDDFTGHKHEYMHSGRSATSGRETDPNATLNNTRAQTSPRQNHHDDTATDYGSSGHLTIHSKTLNPAISSGILPDRSYLSDRYFNEGSNHDYDEYDGNSEDLKTSDDLASRNDDEDLDDDDEDEDWSSDKEDETYL